MTQGPGWTTDTADGTLMVAPSSSDHGRELRIHTEGNGRTFLAFPDLTSPGNSYWARLRLRVDAFPTAPDWRTERRGRPPHRPPPGRGSASSSIWTPATTA